MQPYTLAAASLEGAEWRDISSYASGAVLVGGVALSSVFAIAGVIVGTSSSLGQGFLAVAALVPGLALQQFWRVASFAAQRAKTATVNDSFWAIGQVAAFAFVLSNGRVTVAGGMLAWGAPAWLGAGLGVPQLSVRPRVGLATVRWARKWIRIGAWFTATNATFTFGYLAIAVIITSHIGSAGLGLYRVVQQNLFGPVQLLIVAATMVFVPYLVRTIKRTATTAVRESLLFSIVMAGSVAAYGSVLLIAAHLVVTKVFGTAFAPATVLVVPMLVAFTLDAASSGAELLLQARARGGRLLIAQMAATSARIAGVAVLVSVDGLQGAGWGLVVGSGVGALVSWTQVVLATTR
jgi:O-antigen/teichoic acid export membrane protein